VLWLGALILAASIAGCILLVGLAASLPDDHDASRSDELQFKMPATRSSRSRTPVDPLSGSSLER